jgi:hypothetical protein
MAKLNRQNIDRKTNKPSPYRTEAAKPDLLLNRSEQTRRDDDVIRTPKRTPYDIDYAIKWYIDNEIQPQITHQKQLIEVPVIFANGEKWDNVQRLGYIRDEKGMLQSPLIMIKRNSIAERDNYKNLDINRTQDGSKIIYKQRYNQNNRYMDELFPIPTNQRVEPQQIMLLDIPKYVVIEYDLMFWCDFTTQMNDLVDQFMPHSRFAWGNQQNQFGTFYGSVSFETVNTVGEDRLVRATLPISVHGTLLSGQEARKSTLQRMYSPKIVSFDITITDDLFSTTQVPTPIQQASSQFRPISVTQGGTTTTLSAETVAYLVSLSDQTGTVTAGDTVTVSAQAAINPSNNATATKNEFDLYINGQYIDKQVYTWTPTDTGTQTITFNTATLGYNLQSTDLIIINGRWA